MKNNHYICSLLFLFLFTQSVKASHVVGGTLTYKHNGGSNYTVTLKLFRDCGPGTWTFPNNVTISVRGNNGQEFSPSKDISMPLGTVTLIPSTLSPCAIPPNPIPCVQEGIYTATVNNLPAIEGGYHLYWQIEARNVSISNVNTTCNCIGASFYAYIPGPWYEDFSLADNTNSDNGTSAWTVTSGSPSPTSAEVNDNRFRIEGANNAKATWQSQTISIASCSNVNLSVDLEEAGTLETNDSILVYYRLNGGPLTLFPSNGILKDDFGTSTASVSGLNGNTVQIQVRARFNSTSSSSEIYYFDNVRVSCNTPNSNPTFNLFPPIFICAGQPFTFDHSATDINGDSLAYSFYSPYNGDDNTGALDPTFQGNSAQFTPIVWKPGYSAGSPLGAPPLSLNPTTGLLTGTANSVGQYVVGVVVKEYRNGVLIGQTLRDFQFNVVNCPLPPPPTAGPDVTVNIGCTVQISAGGFNPATVVWNSVAPGTQGAYNNYLSCTAGCANPTVSQLPGAPSYIDFQVCGLTNSCAPTNACDVVRVFFKPALTVSISPVNPIICPGQTSTTLTASGTGGTPPYSFIWNNLNTSPSIVVGSGTYTVKMSDITGCPPVQATVNVTSNPITANAGPDKTVCKQSPTTTINGTVTSASGGIWTGGNGVFSPNNTTLSGATYTPSASELAAGFVNLTLTTTGNGNCPAVSDVVRINYVNFTGTVSTSSTQVSCFGGSDGTATVSITGGSSPYTYAWNTVPAKTTATASNLSIGTYTVTTTNSLGCTITNTVTVTQPTPIALNAAITDVSCSGGSDGSISITASGGTGPYTYVWQPGNQTTSSITGKTAGTYTVTVKDSKLCTTTLSYTINQPAPIVVNLSSNPVSCFNGSNGSASSTVSGGTTPYIYTWSSGATSPNASGLTAGTYTLTVKDNKGCTAVNTTSVSQPSAFTVSVATTPETCNTQNNGTAAANPSGGTPSYSYLWQPGSLTSASLTGLSAGTYTLTVTDAKGCTALSNPVITEPPPLTVSFISQSNVSCNGGNDGTVTANPAGGTPAYSYLWSPGNSTSAKVTSLSAGTYSVTVTDSKGCIAVNSVTITQPLPLTAATSSTNETCDYLNNGTTSVTASGGTSGYTYLWKPDLQTTATATGLKASSYTVTVTDAKGCTTTAIANVAQPAPILLSSGSQNDVSCYGGNDGMSSMNVNGGTPSYTYLWSPGNSTSASANNLAAGKYSITVTDANGCNATAAVQINEPPPIITDVSFSGGTCNGAVNGNVWSSATGGTPGYNYLWQPGAYTTANVTNLSVGTYSLTLTDTKGCMSTTTVQIGEPLPLMVNFVSQKNISCFGGSDGSVAVNTSGGTPNYTYSWMPGGATTNGLSNLSAGTYSVTVTDANGCTTTNSVTITQPVQLTATASGTNETCNYLNNGTANVTVSGGTAGYTYLWKPEGQTSASITGLQADTYTVTVTDTKGCSTTATTVIGQPTPLNVSFSSQNVSCFAGNDGIATAIPTGGTPGYAYLWTPGGNTTATKSNLTAGTYSVTITDIEGCNTTSQVNITQPIPLAAGATKTNETCNYLNDGTATAVANGGTPGYTYLWTPGGNTNVTISSLASGTYSVTITDAKGCTAIASTVVGEPLALTIGFNSQLNVSCFGGNDGSVTASPSGGTANYTYSWMPGGATTNSISNVSAGTYSVTVTDANGCTATNSVTITQPAQLTATASGTNETCDYLNNGTASVTASGGIAGYTYLWKPELQTSASITGLQAGTYTVTVTDTRGCFTTATTVIGQPTPLNVSFSSQNVSCFAGNDGTATATPAGGTPGYTYLWTPGGNTTATKSNLTAGTYSVTITDIEGCYTNNQINITQPITLAAGATKTNETCDYLNDGTATAVANGGTPGYTYLWTPGGNTNVTISSLASGTYSVTITDAKGCTAIASTVVGEPNPLALAFSPKINVSCFGDNSGSVSVSTTGGTANYTYSWMPGAATTSNISNINAGTYSVTVTDANGCVANGTTVISQPSAPLSIAVSATPASCFGVSDGTVNANASGGTGPYTYEWMPGNFSGAVITNLVAGTYTVTVTDALGCVATNTVTINQPAEIVLTTSSTNSDCGQANGTTTVSVSSGGVGPFSYLWSPTGGTNNTAAGLLSGAYTVSVTDATGCQASQWGNVNENTAPSAVIFSVINVSCNGGSDGSASVMAAGGLAPYTYLWLPSGGTNSVASNLTAGTYTVTVTGANGCQSVATTSPEISEPPPIVIEIDQTTISCFGGNDGTATAVASGGTPGYVYEWLPGNVPGPAINGLSANTYTMQVTDGNNCIKTKPVTILQPVALSVNISATPVSCFAGNNGTLSASAAGGSVPYSFSWMPGNISGPAAGQLTAGTYTLTVSDKNGCNLIDSATVVQPTIVTSSLSSVNSNCGLPNGQASVIAGGGTPGYTYLWSPAGGTNATANSLLEGEYSVTVTDNNGCVDKDTVTVNNNPSPSVIVSPITNLTCNGSNDGTATASVTGGTAPFTYLWSPGGATDATVTSLGTGTYTVTVTDANSCQSAPAVSDFITQPNPLEISFVKTDVNCFGGNNGSVSATASGGTAGYIYLWTPGGNTTTTINNLSAGTYTLQITDANNCIKTSTININQPAAPLTATMASTPVSCFAGNNGTVSSSVSGGTAPYTYSWMPGNISGPTAGQLTAQTYTLTITDKNGCSYTDSSTVTQPTIVTTSVSSNNSNCGLANGQATVVAGGGTPGYSYLWSPAGGTNATANSLLAGQYNVTVTDNNGCTDKDTITVNNNSSPVVTVSPITNLTCNGSNDGTATASVTGGTAPFTYLWSPGGATDATVTNLGIGTYTVVVTDANSCQSVPAVSAMITQPDPIFIDTVVTSVSCFGNSDGAITTIVTGGTPTYSYLWSPGSNTTASISSLIAGNYSVQVTDINNCITVKPVLVTQPSPALSATLSGTAVSCYNGNDGTAAVTASGGTPPYSYSWVPGNISGPSIGQLIAGTYTVTVSDANGCSLIDSVTINQPSVISTTTNSVNSNCSLANGQASVIAAGGTPGYTYLWTPVGGTTNNANSLMAGTYYVAVTDNNGCTVQDTVTVNDNSSPSATVSAVTNITCNGASNGTATVSVAGGTAPYTYAWSPSSATTATATGLAPGTYTVVVTDANLCQSLPAISSEITQPNPILIDTSVTRVSCFGNNDGIITANAIGGTPAYSYLWSPGGNTNATISNLAQNTYTVQVTDANNCIQSATIVLTQPVVLTSSISSTVHVSCYAENTGSATVSVTGGTPTYNYNWTPSGGNGPTGNGFAAGSYTVNITDDNGCGTSSNVTITQPAQVLSASGSAIQVSCYGTTDGTVNVLAAGGTPSYTYQWNPSVSTTNTASGLLPGNYAITVIDNNGCETTTTAAVGEPAAITGTLLTTNPSCSQSNGSISTQLSGGTAPYTYLWQQTSATTSAISGLGTGTYNLTVTDSSGCTLTLSAILTITPDPAATIINVKNVSCYAGNDGQASVSVSQGTPPFSISWLPYGGFDTTATLLDTGSYIVNVTDALGCQTSDTVIIAQPAPVDVSAATVTNVLCNGGSSGAVTITTSGGTAPFTYSWAPSGATTANASNLSIGTYSVTVSDSNNCSKAISMIITEPTVLSAAIDSVTQPVCPTTTGNASVEALGGLPPYSYSWSAPAQSEINSVAYNLPAGSYTVTVTDSNGCNTTASVVLIAPTAVVTLAGATDTLCIGQTGTLSANASGGAGGYTYAWQPSGAVTSGTLSVSPTSSTTYTVVAFDQNGCPGNQDTIPIVVYNLNNNNVDVIGDSPICPGRSSFIYAVPSGDTGPLSYQWNNSLGSGPGGFLVTPAQPTTYVVTVTNSCGTSISDSIQILFNPIPTIDLSLLPDAVCSPSLILFDDNSVSGTLSDPITSWLWNFGDGTQSTSEDPSHSYASPGNYLITLTVTTGGGCQNNNASAPFAITATPSPIAAFSMNSTYFDLPHESLTLNNQSTGANSYIWNFGDGSSSTIDEPTYTYTSVGIFSVQLIAMNQYGCSDTATAELTTDAEVVFPNAFTPNPDGPNGGSYDINDLTNDVFFPHTSGVVEFELQIFNRWGELIFESFDIKKGWDGYYRGQLCQQDVYVWKAYVRLNNGKVFNKTGNVTLIE